MKRRSHLHVLIVLEEEDSSECTDWEVMCFMLLITPEFSDARMYLPSWGWGVDEVANCRIYPIDLTHLLMILQINGFFLLRHHQTALEI